MAYYDGISGYGTSSGAGITGIANPIDIAYSNGVLNLDGIADNTLSPVPNITSIGGGLFGSGIGLDDAKFALAGIGSLANIYSGFQAQKLANKQFNFQRAAYNTNLANSVSAYNTSLADRYNSRAKVEGTSSEDAAAQIAAASLKERTL